MKSLKDKIYHDYWYHHTLEWSPRPSWNRHIQHQMKSLKAKIRPGNQILRLSRPRSYPVHHIAWLAVFISIKKSLENEKFKK